MKRPAVGDNVRYLWRGKCCSAEVLGMGSKLDCENKGMEIDSLVVQTGEGPKHYKNVEYSRPFVRRNFLGMPIGKYKLPKERFTSGTWHYPEDWKNQIYGGKKRGNKLPAIIGYVLSLLGIGTQ